MNARDIAERLFKGPGRPKREGFNYTAPCPAHDDGTPSLALADGPGGRLLAKCRAGCSQESVIAALKARGLWPEPDPAHRRGASQRRANSAGGHAARHRAMSPASAGPMLAGTGGRDAAPAAVAVAPGRGGDGAQAALRRATSTGGGGVPAAPTPPSTNPGPDRTAPTAGPQDVRYRYTDTFEVWRWNADPPRRAGKEIRPVHRTDSGTWAPGYLPGLRPLYGAKRLAVAGHILLVEGEKAADAAQALLDAADPDAWAVLTWPGGSNADGKADWSGLTGRTVHLLPDADDAGAGAMDRIGRTLQGSGCAVIEVPHVGPAGSKQDAADWTPGDGAGFLDHIDTGATRLPTPDVGGTGSDGSAAARPAIVLGYREQSVNNLALAAVVAEGAVFEGPDGSLVEIRQVAGAATLVPIMSGRLREMLAESADFVAPPAPGVPGAPPEGKAIARRRVPKWTESALLARRGHEGTAKRLDGISEIPIIHADGTVFDAPGTLDPLSRLFYAPTGPFPVMPTDPTRKDARVAVAVLHGLTRDFPFASARDQSAFVAYMLTLAGRPGFHGPSPAFVMDANIRGTGKSLLAKVGAVAATGRIAPCTTYTGNAEETGKWLLSLALEGAALCLFDDLECPFGDSALNGVLTATVLRGRILGSTKTTGSMVHRITTVASGNNVMLAGDMDRRVLFIRLSTDLEFPENRSGFHHPDILAHVAEHWRRYAAAALTVVAAYLAHLARGEASPKIISWGSFEGWSCVVRGALVWAGEPDCYAGVATFRSGAVMRHNAAVALLHAWRRAAGPAGMTAADAIARSADDRDLRTAIADFAPGRAGQETTAALLGPSFRPIKGKNIGGLVLLSIVRNGTSVWIVRDAPEGPGTAGASEVDMGDFRDISQPTEEIREGDERGRAEEIQRPAGTPPASPPCPDGRGGGGSLYDGDRDPAPTPAEAPRAAPARHVPGGAKGKGSKPRPAPGPVATPAAGRAPEPGPQPTLAFAGADGRHDLAHHMGPFAEDVQ